MGYPFGNRSIGETFKQLSDSLGTDYDEELTDEEINTELNKEFKSNVRDPELKNKAENVFEVAQQEIYEIEERKEDIQNQLVSAKIKDVDFLTHEIKSLILSTKRVLGTLEKDIKIGSSARMYEVYAGLVNAITAQYKELRQLNEAVAKFIIENKKQNLDEKKEEHKMVLNSNEMLDMYMQVQKDSQLNAIDADFEITENYDL